MTEPKKVAFSTLGPIKKEKKKEKKTRTVRITLTLPESNEKSCPEFNYRELLSLKLHGRIGKKNLGDVINGPPLDPSDPFANDEDAALRALAKQFENKYGGYVPAKKKKRRKENDFSTLGEGYDETDPFIDNSDAFDEVMPVHMETKERGFYINSGELDFEEVEEEEGSSSSSEGEESEESETEVKKKKKINTIESDEEEQEEEEDESKKKKIHENGVIRPKKRKLDEGELLRKRKKMIGRFNAKNQVEKKDSDPETEKVVNGCEKKAEEPQPNDQSIAASIEAVISKAREEAGEKKVESQESASSGSDSSSSDSDSSGSSSSSDSESEEEEEEEAEGDEKGTEADDGQGNEVGDAQDMENGHQLSDTEDNIRLPDNLPTDLLQVINRLKEEGHTCKGSSQKFFTDAVNKLLLSIEIKLNKLGGRKKTQIYNHLSQHLPCGTQTIVKRAKNLLAEKQESRLREPLQRLKEAVDSHMPLMMEQHALECQKAAESKGENGAVQNDEEETQDGDKKKSRLPKKKFVFTEPIRKHLCDVVSVRVKFWQMMKKRSETPEDHVRTFLDAEVRPLWPKGWMNARILYKESTEAHAPITDKASVRTTPSKKMVSLGGGNITPTTPTPQPPKPSLSATVIPKTASPVVSSVSKSDQPVVKKKPQPTEQKPSPAPKPLIEGTVSASGGSASGGCGGGGGLSIKSVEKINEEVPTKSSSSEMSTHNVNEEESATKSIPTKLPVKKSAASVSVIDLSSDDDKSMTSKMSSESKQVSKPREVEAVKHCEKEVVVTTSTTTVVTPSVTSLADTKKEDNLEEEMNLVMNELLQISKQKSVDDSVDKPPTQTTKESHVHTPVVTTAVKQQNPYHTPVQETSHHHSLQHSPVQQKHQLPSTAVSQEKEKPVEIQHPKQVSQQNSPVQQKSSPIQLTSPVQQQQLQQQISPVQKQQTNCTMQQHSASLQSQSMQHSPSMSVQQSSSQHSLSSHQNKSHHSSHSQHQKSQMQDPHQQSLKQESSHHKAQSQQYSMSHHQPKQSNLGNTSWSKHDVSLEVKNTPASTNKSPSSWAPGHDVNQARQRQTESLPIVSSSDPLANLRMMHGLSVSSVTKKSSSSTSVYHSPAALATSSTGSYSLPGSKKSSGNISSSAMPNISSTSSHSRPVNVSTTNSSSYSSSQAKHSSSHSYSPQSSKHTTTPPKPRMDPYSASVSQSIYNSISQDQQLKAYKQLQQQQLNHHATQQQQELWQQVNASGYLSGMSGMSNAEVYKLMSQMGKSLDSYTSSSQQGSGQHHGKY